MTAPVSRLRNNHSRIRRIIDDKPFQSSISPSSRPFQYLGGQCQALMVGKLFASVPSQRPGKAAPGSRWDCLISAETTLSMSLLATLTSIT